MTLDVINPTNGKTINSYPEMSSTQIISAITAAAEAFENWSTTSFSQRAQHMSRAGEILRQGAQQYAELMADEMGKPVREGRT